MKRSEMVKKLRKYVYDATDCATLITVEETDLLLSFIEKAGMLPPTIISMPDTYNRADNTYGFEVNEWESEDDK